MAFRSNGIVLIWVTLVLLTGCVSVPSSEPEAVNFPVNEVKPHLGFAACDEMTTTIAVEFDRASEMVPSGFGLPGYYGQATGRTAELYAIFFDCPVNAQANDGASANMILALVVEPPPELRDPDVVLSMLVILTYSTNTEVVTILEAWKFSSVYRGDVEIEISSTGSAHDALVSGNSERGAVHLQAYTLGAEAAPPGAGGRIRMFAVGGDPLGGDPGALSAITDFTYTAGHVYRGPVSATLSGELASKLGSVPPLSLAANWWGPSYDIRLELNATLEANAAPRYPTSQSNTTL